MNTNTKAIYFDMDGTIADLYGVSGWLDDLRNFKVRPYLEAAALINLNQLARKLNYLQKKKGYVIGVVSWSSKESTVEYDREITIAKIRWLVNHMPSVNWDEIHIVPYGTPKEEVVKCPMGILFDDTIEVRENWKGTAFDVNEILEILRGLEG